MDGPDACSRTRIQPGWIDVIEVFIDDATRWRLIGSGLFRILNFMKEKTIIGM